MEATQRENEISQTVGAVVNGNLADGITIPVADPKTIRLREFVKLTNKKRGLDEQLKDVKARLAMLEPQLTEQFMGDGIQSVNVDGYSVYLNRQLFAGPKDGNKDGLVAALKDCDESWSFLVKEGFNSNSLKARIRECELNEQGMPIIPASLEGVMAVYEDFKIGARKSSK